MFYCFYGLVQKITDPEQDVHRAEAVGHEHLTVRHLLRKAVGQQQDLAEICARAEEIGDRLDQICIRDMEQRNQKQQRRHGNEGVSRKQENMLRPFVVAVRQKFFFGKLNLLCVVVFHYFLFPLSLLVYFYYLVLLYSCGSFNQYFLAEFSAKARLADR